MDIAWEAVVLFIVCVRESRGQWVVDLLTMLVFSTLFHLAEQYILYYTSSCSVSGQVFSGGGMPAFTIENRPKTDYLFRHTSYYSV